MLRERSLKVVLVVVGLAFVAAAYPMITFIAQQPALAMMGSLYVTLGIFLLLAVRDPSSHRSLIAFAAWSSFAHAAVMAWQGYRHYIERLELIGVAVMAVIGVALLILAPSKQQSDRSSAAAA